MAHREPEQSIKDDTSRSRLNLTFTFSAFVDTLSETLFAPVLCRERKTGAGQAFGDAAIFAIMECCTPGQFSNLRTGSSTSTRYKRKQSSKCCGGQCAAVRQLEMRIGVSKSRRSWAWNRSFVPKVDRRTEGSPPEKT